MFNLIQCIKTLKLKYNYNQLIILKNKKVKTKTLH